jgi:hypothetical protein
MFDSESRNRRKNSQLFSKELRNNNNFLQSFTQLVFLSIFMTTLLMTLDYYNVFGLSRDRESYILFFDFLSKYNIEDSLELFTHEPGFQYLNKLLIECGTSIDFLYSIQIVLALLPKLLVLAFIVCKFTGTRWQPPYLLNFILSSSFYLCKFFPLQELTQLRVSLSVACLYIGTLLLLNLDGATLFKSINAKAGEKSIKIITGLMYFLSVSFHYSSIAIIILIIIAKYVKTLRVAFISFVAVFLGSLVTTFGFLLSPIVKTIFSKAEKFSYEDSTPITLFSSQRILDIILIISIIFIIEKKSSIQLFSFTIFLYSLAVYYGTSSAPVYAHRLTELLQSISLTFLIASANRRVLSRLIPTILISIVLSLWGFNTQNYFYKL